MCILLSQITSAQIISTFAGTGTASFSGDGGAATAATIYYPEDIEVQPGSCGNVYFPEAGNHVIRRVSPSGVITTVAGIGGSSGYSGDGGPATAARLNAPRSVILDAVGNMYIADDFNHRVRKVNTSGIISTIAGNGSGGYSGDGGQATAAQLNRPLTMAFDASGNLYIGDGNNNRIRMVTPSGIISTVAGGGSSLGDGGPATAAQFSWPRSIVFDPTGNLYIADNYHHRVRIINTSGVINTIAGSGTGGYTGDGGAATAARLNQPNGVDIDANGNLLIADFSNHAVRKVTPAGIITTIAGTGSAGFSGDGGPATAAQLHNPTGVVAENTGRIFISDYYNERVRVICVNPVVRPIYGPDSVCSGSTITLIDTTVCGTWSSASPSIATVSATGVVTGVSSGTVLISYTVTNGCGTTTATKPVTVNPVPAIGTISGPSVICIGTTGTLTESVSGGTWSCTNGHATISTTGVVTGVSIGTDTVYYTVHNICDTARAMFIVNVVNSTITSTISGPTNVCVTATITLTDTTGGGTWSSSNMAVATISSSGVVTGVTAGTTVISYYISAGCGTSLAIKTISVDPLPGITATPSAPAFCSGVTTTITAGGAASYTWLPGTGLSATTGTSVMAHPTATTTYTITGTASTGCRNTLSITVTVYPLPTLSIPGATICAGYNTVLTASGAVSYTWSPATTLSGSTGASVTAAPPATTVYIVHGTDANGCTNTATVSVTVNPTPAAPVSSTPLSYCVSATAPALTASGANLLWYSSATGGTGSTTAPVPSTGTSGTTDFYVSQTLNGCESPRTNIQVIVVDNAFMGFSYDIKYGCTYDTVLFTNTSLHCFGYRWYFGDGTTFTDTTTSPVHFYQPAFVARDFTVKLVGYNPVCYDDSAMQTITLMPNPIQPVVLTSISANDTIFYGTSAQLNATGAYLYLWKPNDGSLSNPNINNPVATPSVTTTYTVYGYDKSGCVDSAKVTIAVKYDDIEFIPSGFTPNNDGKNDIFRLAHLKYGKLVDMSIYNRWGVLVYETNDINKGWDGTLNGVPQDIGVYNYLIITSHTDGDNKIYKGTITLIR